MSFPLVVVTYADGSTWTLDPGAIDALTQWANSRAGIVRVDINPNRGGVSGSDNTLAGGDAYWIYTLVGPARVAIGYRRLARDAGTPNEVPEQLCEFVYRSNGEWMEQEPASIPPGAVVKGWPYG